MKVLHDNFFTETITLPDGEYPMILEAYDVFGHILKDFVAEYYVSGGSLFSGKLNGKIFNENLTVSVDRNPKTNRVASFYDAEGEIARAYELHVDDIYTVSANAFTGTPAVGKYVDATYEIKEAAPETGFAGEIIEEVIYTNSVSYRIRVVAL